MGDQRNDRQPVRPGRGEEEDGDKIGICGGWGHHAMVCVVDTVRHDGLTRSIRSERVHHAIELDDPGGVMQGCQLHGPLDIRYHPPEIQKRTDKANVEKEDQKIRAGLWYEEE